ncbi:MAG: indolepyruvate ferredoxin oxidoreductase subunit alpha [Candidatus Latescibacterota bacterium]|nr:MAG: indolepyruvate ferredoxin oxidoreductase subunit alpha [Candidatus Latescibacterota bacterium]
MKRAILSGNEAIARGAYEAGVQVAAAYPGTPSTEILENLVTYEGIRSQWSPNEKVALEVAIGANLAGVRALAAMKHVGVNVAADPLMTLSYVGVRGGLVLISAGDPGMHSSQNEQDNRFYARLAKIPMLEPSDSQEAKDFVGIAFDLSLKFDTPVMIRMLTRVCHGKSVVKLGEPLSVEGRGYEKNARKTVMVPGHARLRHIFVEARRKKLESFADTFPENRVEMNSAEMGIIAAGAVYQYAKDAFPNASFLKLGLTYPIPQQRIRDFAQSVEKCYVVEELEPFLEDQIKALGIAVIGKDVLPRTGEFSPEIIRAGISGEEPVREPAASLPARPPVLCAGCGHRGLFYVLKKLKLVVTGDIGCYTLSALPPLEAMDTCICMGASIGTAIGMEKALGAENTKKTVAVIGDSTFVHSGITGLVDAVYNRSHVTIIILDNRTTAMTGHQDHPGTGKTLSGDPTVELNFEKLAQAVGVKHIQVVDPYDLKETERVVREETEREAPSVIIARHPCVLMTREHHPALRIDPELCVQCGICLRLGCPAISKEADQIRIAPELCTGCGMCAEVCPREAIVQA